MSGQAFGLRTMNKIKTGSKLFGIGHYFGLHLRFVAE
jgi:hypothetical protein